MKSIAVPFLVLFAASVLSAQMAPLEKASDPKTPALKATAPKAPAGKAVTTATPAKKVEKKKEELPKIPGTVINRPNGTFLSLQLAGVNFKLTFYDKKHKPMAVDVTRVAARWPNTRSADEVWSRTILNPAGDSYMIGQNPVLPPYTWNVYLTLLQGDGDDAKVVEEYTVAFQG